MRGNPSYIGPFTGGLNTRDSVMELPNSLSPDLLNVIGGNDGTVRKRDPIITNGNTFAAAGAFDITSLFTCKAAGTNNLLAGIGTKIYKTPALGGGAATDITGAAVFTSDTPWSWVNAVSSGGQGPMYGLPGDISSTPQQWTGAGNLNAWTASAGTLPKGDQILYFKNRVVMCGVVVGGGSGVTASKVGDPRAWDTTIVGAAEAWSVNLDPNDGSTCNGMGIVGNYLIVFKKNKIFVIYDMDTGANRQISNNLGVNQGDWRTVVSTPFGLCFMANDGHVYITDGSKVDRLSDIVSDPNASGRQYTKDTLGVPAANSAASLRKAAGFYDNRLYLTVMYSVTLKVLTWVYDFPTKTWWRWSGGVYQYAEIDFVGNIGYNAYGGIINTAAPAPVVGQLFVSGVSDTAGTKNDIGVSYNAYYCTPALAPAGKGINFNLRRRYHALRGFIAGTVDIAMASDVLGSNPPTYTTLQSLTNRPVDFPLENTVYSLGVANNVQFKFTSTDGFAWELHPFYLYTQPRTD